MFHRWNMEVSEVDRQLIKLLQSRKNLSQIELCNGFLDIARNQSDFSGFPVNNFIESLVKVCISKLSKSFRKLDQSDSQDVFMVIEEIIEIFTQDSQTRRPLLTSEGLIGSLLELVVIDCTPFWTIPIAYLWLTTRPFTTYDVGNNTWIS